MSGVKSDGSMIVVDVETHNNDGRMNNTDCEHDGGYSLSKDNHGDDVFQCKKCHFFTVNKGGMKTHQTRVHKLTKPKKRMANHEEDKIEHDGCVEDDHHEEKKIRKELYNTPQSTQKEEDSFDDIINAANK